MAAKNIRIIDFPDIEKANLTEDDLLKCSKVVLFRHDYKERSSRRDKFVKKTRYGSVYWFRSKHFYSYTEGLLDFIKRYNLRRLVLYYDPPKVEDPKTGPTEPKTAPIA